MYLTSLQTLLMILAIAAGTILTRFLPFVLFPESKEVPAYITYLGTVLPSAMMGLLIVYCLKNVSLTMKPYAIPELLSILSVVILHKWKHNVFLSICIGTALYMFLVQAVFA